MAPAEDLRARFETETTRLLPELYGAARRLTGEHADAEDLVAEAVARAWQNQDALRDPDAFRGWLFRILTNAFLMQRRARSVRPDEESLEEYDGDVASADFSLFEKLHAPILLWWGNPEREFLNNLLREDLERAVAALPDAFRVVVVLVDVQGFSYQETAAALDVPVGTVRSRLARARSRLQQQLWQHASDAGLVPPQPEA